MTQTYTVYPAFKVTITLDPAKFTLEFFEQHEAGFGGVYDLPDVVNHLAQLWARGMVDNDTKFIEGFGDPKEFGIKFSPSSAVDANVEFD